MFRLHLRRVVWPALAGFAAAMFVACFVAGYSVGYTQAWQDAVKKDSYFSANFRPARSSPGMALMIDPPRLGKALTVTDPLCGYPVPHRPKAPPGERSARWRPRLFSF